MLTAPPRRAVNKVTPEANARVEGATRPGGTIGMIFGRMIDS